MNFEKLPQYRLIKQENLNDIRYSGVSPGA